MEKHMAMVPHYDKGVEKERLPLLYAIQMFHGFACVRRIPEVRYTVLRHRRHEHQHVIAKGM